MYVSIVSITKVATSPKTALNSFKAPSLMQNILRIKVLTKPGWKIAAIN
jgi:hypothetical protein